MDRDREKLNNMVRALLIPEKTGLPIARLEEEYRAMCGEKLPFSRFGYSSLEDFIHKNPQLFQVVNRPTGACVMAVVTPQTSHVANLVEHQRTSSKKAKITPNPARRPHYLPTRSNWVSTPSAGANGAVGRGTRGTQYGRKPPGGTGRFPSEGPLNSDSRAMVSNYLESRLQRQERPAVISDLHLRTPRGVQQNGFQAAPQQLSPNMKMHTLQNQGGLDPTRRQNPNTNIGKIGNRGIPNGNERGHRGGGGRNSSFQSRNTSGFTAPSTGNNYRLLLSQYFKGNGLGEMHFKTVEVKGSNLGRGGGQHKVKAVTKYLSSIKVGDKTFMTYPDEYPSPDAAEEAVSKLACQSLHVTTDNNGVSSPGSSTGLKKNDTDYGEWNNTTALANLGDEGSGSFEIVVDRISSLVGSRTNGVWWTQIEVEYNNKFAVSGDKLPPRWIEKLRQSEYGCSKLRVDHPLEGRYIILPVLEEQMTQNALSPIGVADKAVVADRWEKTLPLLINPPDQRLQPQSGIRNDNDKDNSSLDHLLCLSKMNNDLPEVPTTTETSASSQERPPSLVLPKDNVWYVYITSVHNTTDVCLRLMHPEYSDHFDDLVTNMELHYFEAEKIPRVSQPKVGRLYAAMVDGDWHRVEITSLHGIHVLCYFIDLGDKATVNVSDLRELDPTYLKLAPQAKHVRLAGLEHFKDSKEAQITLTNLTLGRSLIATVNTRDEKTGVELVLVDTSAEDEDVNINQKLLEKLEPNAVLNTGGDKPPPTSSPHPPDVSSGNVDQNSTVPTTDLTSTNAAENDVGDENSIKDLMNSDIASFKPLIPPQPPAVGEYFDVTITITGSPSNFTVQPYTDGLQLEELQVAMNEFYGDSSYHYKEPIRSHHLMMDKFFAGRHTDGAWYRIKVNSMLDDQTASVRIVDFGDFTMMSLDDMQPLWPQFRNLAMQAINASLGDVVAANGDWNPSDCVWFNQRVVNKQFVSKIKSVIPDPSDQECGLFKLSISLYDTSNPNEDILLEKELVDSGRAVYHCVM